MSKIIIYTTSKSRFSDLARDFFKERSIKFEEIDISKNSNKSREMTELSDQFSVPVIKIDDKVIVGFDENKLKEALKKHRPTR